MAVVVNYFCEMQPDTEECYNLAPVVKYLHREVDLLNAFLLITKIVKIDTHKLYSNPVQKVFKFLCIQFILPN